MTAPAALLLDLDGTLVDSEPVHRAVYRVFLEQRGWTDVDPGIFTGRRAEDVFAAVPGPWADQDPRVLHDAVVRLFPADARPEPVPGAAETVRAAHAAGIPVAVVTSAGPDWVHRSVADVLGVRHLVSVVVTARDVSRGKPDPACYALACERLGVHAAGSLAVEDAPAGIRSAVAAGVGRVLGISTTWGVAELLAAGAVDVVPDLSGVAARLAG